MEKLTALVLALLLVLSLASCGSAPGGTVTPGESAAAGEPATPEESTAPEETAGPEESTAPEEAEETEPETGVVQGGVYTNEFLGIACALDDEWTIASEEELLSMVGLTADGIADEDLADTIRDSGLIYDFYATAQGGLVSLNVVIEDLGVVYGMAVDEAAYVEAARDQVLEALEDIGLENGQVTAETITFAGREHECLWLEGSLNEVPFYEAQVCVKVGNYMAVVTAASFQGNITGDLLELFTAVG